MIKTKPRFKSRQSALKWLSGVYYPSDHWKAMRLKVLKRHPICQECRVRPAVQVHHRNYDRLWAELSSDLTAICVPCHDAIEYLKKKQRREDRKASAKVKAKKHLKKRTPSFLKKMARSVLKD